nr:FAD-binding oxidoreductase [uncultured Carboxylicivirga sp.]
MTKHTDILIIGQGLAGTVLSYQLVKKNINHLVIDIPLTNTATKVAAGLINPIGIKRMVKSWNVDILLPYAKEFYSEIESFLKHRFFYPTVMDKIYGETDLDFWTHRYQKAQLHAYIETNPTSQPLPKEIKAPYGFGRITEGARLDMQEFLKAYRSFLISSNLLIEDEFSEKDLYIKNKIIEWKDIRANKIIFCRGEADARSSFFDTLNFRNTKGELLDVEIPGLKLNNILLKGLFVLPTEKHRFKIGATFQHEWNNLLPTMSKKEELLDKWALISDLPLNINKQLTGIRPTMHDRRPVIGFLPHQTNIGIFNGLGSRGGLLAPYLAHQFVNEIIHHTSTLFKEVKIDRYFK